MSTQNKTGIELELKKLNSNFNTFNKIMSSFLVIATSESTFKNKTNKEIKSIVPVVSSTLKAINESIYDTAYTNQEGKARFSFNDVYQLGQAGVVVLNIRAKSGTDVGDGIIKIEEEVENVETVYI